MNIIHIVLKYHNHTLIMVTHVNYIEVFADKIIRIKDGKIIDMKDNTEHTEGDKNENEENV